MLSTHRPKKLLWAIVLTVLLLLVALDRGSWANVAQWREDQATNLWLGYTTQVTLLKVGLISSVVVPNPNGMPLAGVLLSRLPGLWWVSLVLGVLQGGLVTALGWLIFPRNYRFWLFVLPALTSVILRATSVEFWNQWMFASLNLFFLLLLAVYWRRPSIWLLPGLVLPMLAAPALYLAGLANAVVYFLLAGAAVLIRPPRGSRRAWVGASVLSIVLLAAAFFATWLPYARAMQGKALPGTAGLGVEAVLTRFKDAGQTLLTSPIWLMLHWTNPSDDTFYQSSSRILPETAVQLLGIVRGLNLVQALAAGVCLLSGLIYGLARRRPKEEFFVPGQSEAGRAILLGMVLVILAFVGSPLLGGLVLAQGERMDQAVQFLPFFLFAWFALPFLICLPARIQPAVRGMTVVCALAYVAVNLALGAQVISAHLEYRGSFLSEADVPLAQKLEAVDFIAKDWKAVSSDAQVAVSYDLGGDKWDFVTGLGFGLEKYYPAPMTIGRALDYQLLRVYGLSNRQEGVQARSKYPTHYLVSYAFKPEPMQEGFPFKHYLFGRLRVSVVQ